MRRTLRLTAPARRPAALQRGVACAADQRLDAVYRQLLEVDDTQHMKVTDAQRHAVALATRGYSVFLHLPTGAGKSLAFQAPALLAPRDKLTLVVSPLVALINDQVAALRRKGVEAMQISGDDRKPNSPPVAQVLAGQRLVYTTPEFLLMNAEMREWVRRAGKEERLARVVLDEAHCVLEWGNTFRPAYLELSHWKAQFFDSVPLTLATASVSDENIARLAELFHLQLLSSAPETSTATSAVASRHDHLAVIQQVTDRENLRLEVVRKPEAGQTAARIAQRVQRATTIVYCLTRNEAESVCLALVRLGCHAGVYHGGLPKKRREFVRKQWMLGQLSIICATSAFGMGIDRADVRFIVHHSLPLSLSAYSQQTGRGGRDGKPAVCVLMYSEKDKSRADYLSTERPDCNESLTTPTSNGSSHAELEEMAAFCEQTTGCRKELLYSHFGFQFDGKYCSRNCNCGEPLEEPESWANEALDKPEERSGVFGVTTNEDAGDISKGTIEYYYQKILAESKRLGLPKREALSRRVVKDILETEPMSELEMANMRGVGSAKASRYFSFFRFN